MKLMVLTLTALVMLAVSACTDVQRASLGAFGDAATITCYSGGRVFYQGQSTGRVKATDNSDGWEFKDAKTGKFVRLSGSCVVEN